MALGTACFFSAAGVESCGGVGAAAPTRVVGLLGRLSSPRMVRDEREGGLCPFRFPVLSVSYVLNTIIV